jgi:hypothetical protein
MAISKESCGSVEEANSKPQISHLSAPDAPFDGLLERLELGGSGSKEALHAGVNVKKSLFFLVADERTKQVSGFTQDWSIIFE